jgi:hypothetical protein
LVDVRARDIKKAFGPTRITSRSPFGCSAQYVHPVHDVESLISRFGARPTIESVRNAERKFGEVVDLKV